MTLNGGAGRYQGTVVWLAGQVLIAFWICRNSLRLSSSSAAVAPLVKVDYTQDDPPSQNRSASVYVLRNTRVTSRHALQWHGVFVPKLGLHLGSCEAEERVSVFCITPHSE